MIGMAYTATVKFYDAKNAKMSFKARPVLIIGQADHSDYIVLPISRVSKPIVDFKKEYPDKYAKIIKLVKDFQRNMIKNAL